MENQHVCHDRLGCIKIKLYSGKEFRLNLARKVSSKCLLHKAFWDPDIYILSILRLKLPFFSECLDGNYGQNCINECGHCHNNDPCDKVTGTCTTCAPGYKGSNCFEGASRDSCITHRHTRF